MTTASAIPNPFPSDPEPKTVQEMMDVVFGEPTPTWSLTDFSDCFVYLRRAWKIGWRFRRWRNAAIQVHKPNGGGWHVLTVDKCSDCYKYAKDGTCSHSEMIGRAGGLELVHRVLLQFDFSQDAAELLVKYQEVRT